MIVEKILLATLAGMQLKAISHIQPRKLVLACVHPKVRTFIVRVRICAISMARDEANSRQKQISLCCTKVCFCLSRFNISMAGTNLHPRNINKIPTCIRSFDRFTTSDTQAQSTLYGWSPTHSMISSCIASLIHLTLELSTPISG